VTYDALASWAKELKFIRHIAVLMASAASTNNAVVQAGMLKIPVAVIESWPAPNYIDPAKQPPQKLIAYATIFGLLAILTAAGRLWSRFRLQRNAGIDDYFFIAALVRDPNSATIRCANISTSLALRH
jgi:hypothetical protein